ncbi:MAG: hypothetical protein JWM98_3407 [Thermoleophilia bacterium]|nr:hypothetical protein [Thermoleophilia bacterium]
MERSTDEVSERRALRAASIAYHEATLRYEQLMRHRLMNPLTVIAGMADTLCRVPDLHPSDVQSMHEAILIQAQVLVSASTEPRALDDVEACVDPWPCTIARRSTRRMVGVPS